MTFAFYDLKTTGLSPAFNQPLQFAAILSFEKELILNRHYSWQVIDLNQISLFNYFLSDVDLRSCPKGIQHDTGCFLSAIGD